MKKNPYYQLRHMAGVPYLVTFGQGHADFLRDVQLNETGVFLWEHLEETNSLEQLCRLCLEHFHCSREQQESMQQNIRCFLDSLRSRGIILPDKDTPLHTFPAKTLEIAALHCRIHAPEVLFSSEMLAFEIHEDGAPAPPLQDIYLLTTPPFFTENGVVIVRTRDLTIMECEDKFVLLFTSFSKIKEAHIRKDGITASIHCTSTISGNDRQEFSYVIRMLFFYFALQHQVVALHSASILYRDKVWLFSAPSGTGKSTHARLWKELFGACNINGDINLLTYKERKAIVYGNPWHGTSGIYHTDTFPLGGILLLKQSSKNLLQNLSADQKELFLLHRCITPTWTARLLDLNHTIIREISPSIFVAGLACTPDASAAHYMKAEIDKYIGEK